MLISNICQDNQISQMSWKSLIFRELCDPYHEIWWFVDYGLGSHKRGQFKSTYQLPEKFEFHCISGCLKLKPISVYGYDSVVVQDNAPCHKSRSTLTYLDNKQICLLSGWPPQSLDINIIENLWSILKLKMTKRYPISTCELWSPIEDRLIR